MRKKTDQDLIDDDRRLMRAAQEFYLRSTALIAEHFPSDLIRGIIWIAINSANTGYLLERDGANAADKAERDSVPSSARRPVTRLALAHSLGIPYETCRRHANVLLAEGWCLEVGRAGLIVNGEKLEAEAFRRTRAANAINAKRFLRRLKGH